ncbi:hypothetical protein B296_00043122 [Ensete ventricosum]|uniref:Uncharacterized protein n=1 Tax=Ensete ventricosum TaxID=4639 RepID=A0A426ZBR1_ENSVE|nr:hypothetical protein B296_00043122 [Ensete ventricosum]
MITLYVEERSTTIKVLVLGSSPKVIGRVTTPTEVIASLVQYVDEAPCIYHNAPDAGVCNMGHDHQGVVMIWVFALGFKGDPRIASCSGPLLDFGAGISFPCRGVVTTCARAACDDIYLPLHKAFRVEGRLSLLSYIPVKVVTTYEVLDLVFQIITFFGVMFVVTVEAAVASAIPLYGLSPHRVGSF